MTAKHPYDLSSVQTNVAMKHLNITVENLKCGGCEKTVQKILLQIDGVRHVEADNMTGVIKVDYLDEFEIEDEIKSVLKSAGYPSEGTSSIRDKAVSYISCAKGKLS